MSERKQREKEGESKGEAGSEKQETLLRHRGAVSAELLQGLSYKWAHTETRLLMDLSAPLGSSHLTKQH